MNLRLCVLALLLLWLSLTAVCGGECAPLARPRSPRRSSADAAALPTVGPTRALSACWSLAPAGQKQPRVGQAG